MDADTFAEENLLAYFGDVDCATYGGTFFHLNRDHRENGYIEAMRIFQLDDAPFSSLILVESLTLLPDEPGSDNWNACASCIGLTREEYDKADEMTKMQMDAEACLAYGRYDPAECFPSHHTFAIAIEPVDEDAESILETGNLKPDANAYKTDEDGDVVFDEAEFWILLQERVDVSFCGLTGGENISRPESETIIEEGKAI